MLAAGMDSSPACREALERLCHTYWYPLYAYARRRGHAAPDAEDLIQGFFMQLLERGAFRERTPERGRFRSFLLTAFNYYAADERDRRVAAKRGGGVTLTPLDALAAEERYRVEPVEQLTPESIFERRWALTLVETVIQRLESEYDHRREMFLKLRPVLFNSSAEIGYADLAPALNMSAGAVRVALHRMRQRCRELFREEVARTVSEQTDIEAELRYLRQLLGK